MFKHSNCLAVSAEERRELWNLVIIHHDLIVRDFAIRADDFHYSIRFKKGGVRFVVATMDRIVSVLAIDALAISGVNLVDPPMANIAIPHVVNVTVATAFRTVVLQHRTAVWTVLSHCSLCNFSFSSSDLSGLGANTHHSCALRG